MTTKTNFEISQEIISYIIGQLGLLGYKPESVADLIEDEEEPTPTPEKMLEEAFAVDGAVLWFRGPEGNRVSEPKHLSWIAVIPENGMDVVHDYPARGEFSSAMDGIMESLDNMQCNKCGRKEPTKNDRHWCRYCGSTEMTQVMSEPQWPF